MGKCNISNHQLELVPNQKTWMCFFILTYHLDRHSRRVLSTNPVDCLTEILSTFLRTDLAEDECLLLLLVSSLLRQGTLASLLDCYGITCHCVRLWCHVLSCFVPTCLLQLPGFSRHRLPHLGPVRRRVEAKLINWPFSPLRADWGQQISVR